MTIMNMVGGGGDDISDSLISISSIITPEQIGGLGKNSTAYSVYSPTVSGVDGIASNKYQFISGTRTVSFGPGPSSNYLWWSAINLDVTSFEYPAISNWVNKYGISNASGTMTGFWTSTIIGNNAVNYNVKSGVTENQNIYEYNITINNGIVDISSDTNVTVKCALPNRGNTYTTCQFVPLAINILTE